MRLRAHSDEGGLEKARGADDVQYIDLEGCKTLRWIRPLAAGPMHPSDMRRPTSAPGAADLAKHAAKRSSGPSFVTRTSSKRFKAQNACMQSLKQNPRVCACEVEYHGRRECVQARSDPLQRASASSVRHKPLPSLTSFVSAYTARP